jgi:SAM-dependent methyltransferase
MSSSSLAGSVDGVPERFVPEEMGGKLVEAEHVARYLWASNFVTGRRTLDAGCGTGYGSKILSAGGALEVVGVDLAEHVLEVASQDAPENVRYEVGDLAQLPFDSGSFECVVCFEVIEHVEDPDVVLDELKRVLAPNGLLIISSPNRDHYMPGNPHHRHEYSPPEFRDALAARFADVRLVQQHVMLASVVAERLDTGSVTSPIASSMVDAGPGSETYTLALAGDSLPDTSSAVMALTRTIEIRELLEHAERQDEEVRKARDVYAEMEDARRDRHQAIELLAEREQEAAELPVLEERVRFAEAQLHAKHADLTGQIHELGHRLADLGAELAESHSALDRVTGSLSWRITRPLRAVKRLLARR